MIDLAAPLFLPMSKSTPYSPYLYPHPELITQALDLYVTSVHLNPSDLSPHAPRPNSSDLTYAPRVTEKNCTLVGRSFARPNSGL